MTDMPSDFPRAIHLAEQVDTALTDMHAVISAIHARYEIVASAHRTMLAVLRLMPDTREKQLLLAMAETELLHVYELANSLSSLERTKIASSDFRVVLALLRSMLEENNLIEVEQPTNVTVYELKEKSA